MGAYVMTFHGTRDIDAYRLNIPLDDIEKARYHAAVATSRLNRRGVDAMIFIDWSDEAYVADMGEDVTYKSLDEVIEAIDDWANDIPPMSYEDSLKTAWAVRFARMIIQLHQKGGLGPLAIDTAESIDVQSDEVWMPTFAVSWCKVPRPAHGEVVKTWPSEYQGEAQ